jgi:spore germination cell wall hydrolase CwlJ-like protein
VFDRRSLLLFLGGAVVVACTPALAANRRVKAKATAKDIDTAARVVWGEARGEPWRGKVAVMWVLVNRTDHAMAYMKKTGSKQHALYGNGTLDSAARMPWQFSIFNSNDPNRKKLKDAHKRKEWAECLAAVHAVLDGVEESPISKCCHYCLLKSRPAWAKGLTPVTAIGGHKFYHLL